MTNFRKIAAFILCFVLISALLPIPEISAADGELVLNVYYKSEGDHAVVTGCSDGATDITVRSVYNGRPVTEIADSAFLNKTTLKKVTVSESVKKIGYSAFQGCTNLEEFTFYGENAEFGINVFRYCENMKKVNISDITKWLSNNFSHEYSSPTYMAHSLCIDGSPVTKVVFPEDTTEIAPYALAGCSDILSVKIPDGVTVIGDGAFRDCSGITEISLPDSVTSIGEYALSGCSFSEVVLPDSVTTLGDCIFELCTSLEKITFPKDIEKIPNGFFGGCSSLTEIVIPEGVVEIGRTAFASCTALEKITFPTTLKNVGRRAFFNDSALKEIHISDIEKWCGVTFDTDPTELPFEAHDMYLNGEKITSLSFPDGLTEIKSFTFTNVTGLTDVEIPDSVSFIGSCAFFCCTDLKTLKLPDNDTTMANYAFGNCTALEKAIIPEGITTIYPQLFMSCRELTIVATRGSAAAEAADLYGISLYLLERTPTPPQIASAKYTLDKKLSVSVSADIYEPYEYSTDGENWTKATTFTAEIPTDGIVKVYRRVAKAADYNESFASKPETVYTTAKSPKKLYTTETSIALVPEAGYEYRIQDGEWQDSNIFENLEYNGCYSFVMRKKTNSGFSVEGPKTLIFTAPHTHVSTEWIYDQYEHYMVCPCGEKFNRGNHSGGEATCSRAATCDICQKPYGAINAENHKNTVIRNAVTPTCTESGYSGDVYCDDCSLLISSGKVLAKQHKYFAKLYDPEPGKKGYTLITCSECGDSYKTNFTEYKGDDAPVISVDSVYGIVGKTVKVAISLENNPGIVSMLLSVKYDETALRLIKVEDGHLLGGETHSPDMKSPYTLCWVNDTETENFTASGKIAILTFEILDGAKLGKTPISVSYDYDAFDIMDKDGNQIYIATNDGAISVSDVLIGDVNGDGTVNSLDRLLLTRWLAKWPEALAAGINEAAADVNCDGKVNSLDRLILARHLARWEEYATLPYIK